MLIIGDPGTAKSKLLDLACDLARGSRKCDASSATAAGLTGACVQQQDLYTNQKRWAVLPGEIPLTPEGAVCAIDEFNLYKGDYGDVNLAMESGEVIISKVVKARLPVKCAIIAGANPDGKQSKRKKFNKMIPLAEQIELDHTLLQRFDMIFVILDVADKDKDEKIGFAMLRGLTEDDGSSAASVENTSNNLCMKESPSVESADAVDDPVSSVRPFNIAKPIFSSLSPSATSNITNIISNLCKRVWSNSICSANGIILLNFFLLDCLPSGLAPAIIEHLTGNLALTTLAIMTSPDSIARFTSP